MIDFHLGLLNDTVRVNAFRQAIHEVVRPGDIVLDLGTGTGILACFACQAGAAHVYAIEKKDIIQVAREIANANGYGRQITFIQGDITLVDVPEPADVIIAELIGVTGLEENILPIFEAVAKKGWLKPTCRSVPAEINILFAPWEAPKFYKELQSLRHENYGLNLQPFCSLLTNRLYGDNLESKGRLSEARILWQFSLPAGKGDSLSAETCFVIERSGTLHGFACWFKAGLSPTVCVSNSPLLDTPPTSWEQAFFPVEDPIDVQPDDRVSFSVSTKGEDKEMLWGWKGKVLRGERELASFSAHMFFGLVPPSSPLAVMSKGVLPTRSVKGDICLEILSAMDGKTPLEELARRLYKRFPNHLKGLETAHHHIFSAVKDFGLPGEIGSKPKP